MGASLQLESRYRHRVALVWVVLVVMAAVRGRGVVHGLLILRGLDDNANILSPTGLKWVRVLLFLSVRVFYFYFGFVPA